MPVSGLATHTLLKVLTGESFLVTGKIPSAKTTAATGR